MHLPPVLINEQKVDLDHLSPIRRRVTLTLPGHKSKVVDVDFHFTSHCYSRGLREGEQAPGGQAVPDGSKEKPRPRVFDAERYTLSKDLVGLLDQLVDHDGMVSKSRHENFFRVDKVPVERDGTIHRLSYFIFMHARKLDLPNRPRSLLVTVESAYAEVGGIPSPVGRGTCRFSEMLAAKWAPASVNAGRGKRHREDRM